MNIYLIMGCVMFGFTLGVLAESERKFNSKLFDGIFDGCLALAAGALWPLVFVGVILLNVKFYFKDKPKGKK